MGHYPFPWDRFLRLARDLPGGRHSLVEDCKAMVSRVSPPPSVRGAERIPADGPVALAVNHYQRRGLWIAWPGAVITTAVAGRRGPEPPLHWLATGGLRLFQWRGSGPQAPFSGVILARVAQIYQMAALPLDDSRGRAAALRLWLRWALQGEAVALFPEGVAGSSRGLVAPQAGLQSLCRILGRHSVPVLPTAVWEEAGVLTIAFGSTLVAPTADSTMRALAALLPAELRGPYRSSSS